MRRISRKLTIVLVLVMLLSAIPLTGCGEKKDTISVGQWLALVNQTFGMESYQQETPHFENIPKDSPYFATVQIAAEWEVIDTTKPIEIEAELTWGSALVTLVNVGNFLPVDTPEEEKIEYAIEHFDNTIRTYWMKSSIEVDKAIYLLGIAHDQWAGATFDHVIEEVTYKEDVVDLTQEGTEVDNYIIEGNLVKIPISSGVELKEGDVYVLPGGADRFVVQAYKAEQVYQDEEYIYVENSPEELGLEDVAEELFVEETYMPTMDKSIVYDGNGNILSVGADLAPVSYREDGSPVYARRLTERGDQNYSFTNLAAPVKKKIQVGEYEVTYEFSKSGSFYFKASVEAGASSKSEAAKLKTTASAEISNVKITNEIDWKLFRGLKSASLKLDYQTELKGEIEATYEPPELIVAPYNNRNSNFWTNLKNASLKSRTDKGAKTIKIASVDVHSIGVARVCLDINLKIEANGSFTVLVTESGTKGVEYKNGNLRVINDSTKNTNVELEGSIELTGGIGPALYAFGLKKKIIGAQIRIGVGGESRIATHLADPERHLLDEMDFGEEVPAIFTAFDSAVITTDSATIEEIARSRGGLYKGEISDNISLHVDTCIDLAAYFILKIDFAGDCLAGGLLGGGKSWDIFGKNNAKLFSIHVDNFDWASAWANKKVGWNVGKADCTLQYVPFDTEEEPKDAENSETESQNVEEQNDGEDGNHIEMDGDMIVLDRVMMTVSVEGKSNIIVTKIPAGYTPEDLQFKSSNEKIVTVDTKGNFMGIAEGSAIITISTKDGKYKAYCAVTILSEENFEFTPVRI